MISVICCGAALSFSLEPNLHSSPSPSPASLMCHFGRVRVLLCVVSLTAILARSYQSPVYVDSQETLRTLRGFCSNLSQFICLLCLALGALSEHNKCCSAQLIFLAHARFKCLSFEFYLLAFLNECGYTSKRYFTAVPLSNLYS